MKLTFKNLSVLQVVRLIPTKSTDIGTVLRHLENNHPAGNYFFRTRFNCPQLQSRCVSCQYSFPSETYLLKHDCRGYQDAADHDDQSIDNIISDSLENEEMIEGKVGFFC